MAEEFPPCPSRKRLTQFKSDGTKDYVQRCAEQEAPMANKDVEPSDCLACPLRLHLINDSGKYQPPTRKPATTKPPRKDAGGGGFVPCYHRVIMTVRSCCGKNRDARVCDLNSCQFYQGEVTQDICASCPLRSIGQPENPS